MRSARVRSGLSTPTIDLQPAQVGAHALGLGVRGGLMLSSQLVEIGALKPDARNARTHSKKQVRQIANSISEFGFVSPIVVDERHVIIAGHGRYMAAKLLGLPQVPVIEVKDLSEAKRRALAIADNKIAQNAGWDREMLAAELAELAEIL